MSADRLPADGNFIEHETLVAGNVFLDIGFPQEKAASLLIRTDLMIEIERIMQARGLKQKKAAELFGVSQPRISDLTRGKIDEFTIDSLVNMLAHAGVRVDVSVSPSEEPQAASPAEAAAD
ncbi:MAG TPA: helix-turn-helix transcriptional regulator [Longimicrobium sp.]|nr:helix-turn-helix transcriptional regulator [Longimicrobium sp.]